MDAVIVNADGTWTSSKYATVDATGKAVAKHARKRYRATVVIIEDGKVLLVRDKGRRDFSMPGGGFKKGETTIQAGIREVAVEELTGVQVQSTERLRHCDFDGRWAYHKVVRLRITGEPRIRQRHELDSIAWWDMQSELLIQGHVRYILGRMRLVSNKNRS